MDYDEDDDKRRRGRRGLASVPFACCCSAFLVFLIVGGALTAAILVPLLIGPPSRREAAAGNTTTTMTTTTTVAPTTAPACVPTNMMYVSYEDQFFGPGITYQPAQPIPYGYNSSLGLMDPATGVITFIGQMAGLPPSECNDVQCYGNTVRALYMGPDQQLYGTAWENSASIVPTWLYKIDTTNANAQTICQFLPYYLNYQTIGIGIDSTGVMYWKRPGYSEVLTLDLGTCAVSVFSAPFNATGSTVYFDKLYFINEMSELLRIDLPNPTVINTGFTVDVFYNVPFGSVFVNGTVGVCFSSDMCWAPTTFFPFIDASLATSLRAAYGSIDVTYEPFVTIDETTGFTTLVLNRSITSTGQIVYGAAPTCYHNISVNIPPLAKRQESANPILFSTVLPSGNSLITLYEPATKTAQPLGMVEGVSLVKLFAFQQQQYAVSSLGALYMLTGATAQHICAPVDATAFYGFHGSVIWIEKDGFIRALDPVSCTLAPTPIAAFACGAEGAVLNNVLYCVSSTDVTSVDAGGIVTPIGSHAPFSPGFKVFTRGGSLRVLELSSEGAIVTVDTQNGSVSSSGETFAFYTTPFPWYPSSSSS
jgi:hypothetical protein